MVLLAGFSVLLSRLSGQYDFALGTPVAHRTHIETESVVGVFANTLVMRMDLREQPSVRDFIRRAREEALSAYAHQDLPFEQLVDRTNRDMSRSQLFQAVFVLQNTPVEVISLGAAELAPFPFDPAISKLDVLLNVTERGGKLCAFFEYATALFDSATVAGWAEQLERILRAMVAGPDQPVHALPMFAD